MLKARKSISVRETPVAATGGTWEQIQQFVITNARTIGIAAGVIVIIVVGWYFYKAGQDADNLEATRQLNLAQTLYQQNMFKQAIAGDPARRVPGLKEISEKFGGTPTGELATLYLGNSYLYTNDFDKAIAAYDEVDGPSDLVNAAATAGMAAAYEGKKDYKAAAEYYEKAAGMYENEFAQANRIFNAARSYLLIGEKDKAAELFKKLEDFETPRYEADVERLKAQYGIVED